MFTLQMEKNHFLKLMFSLVSTKEPFFLHPQTCGVRGKCWQKSTIVIEFHGYIERAAEKKMESEGAKTTIIPALTHRQPLCKLIFSRIPTRKAFSKVFIYPNYSRININY